MTRWKALSHSVLVAIATSLLLSQVAVASVPAGGVLNSQWKFYLQGESGFYPNKAFPFQSCFEQSAREYNLPLSLLLAVARGESYFDPKARSHANAYGVMQILWPQTANHLGITSLSELLKPCVNIDAGSRYLRELMDRYDNNVHLSLAAYNYGPGRIKPNMTVAGMPKGARWYSHYIHNHLKKVLLVGESGAQGERKKQGERQKQGEIESEAKLQAQGEPQGVVGQGRTIILSFKQPYRAEAFHSYLQAQVNNPNIEVMKGYSGYDIVFNYQSQDEYHKVKRALQRLGFTLQS